MKERDYLISISAYIVLGPARIGLLHRFFGSYEKIWKASGKELVSLGLDTKIANGFIGHRDSFDYKNYSQRLEDQKIKTLTILEENYPYLLSEIKYPPTVLYYKGDLAPLDYDVVAIVGSRKMTSYGKEVANEYSSKISQAGFTIASGLARGIDTIAHKAAIEYGRTIAVVACGLDKCYPPENYNLVNKIVNKKSLVLSEYPLGYPAFRHNFAVRNRIISGLSKAVVVIEGRKKSGTLLTASHAATQGKEVFAVPGNIFSPFSEAPHFLIKNGAVVATSVDDIFDCLGVSDKSIKKTLPSTNTEKEVLSRLDEPLHIDEVARICSLSIGKLVSVLSIMEVKGLVKNIGDGIYRKL